MRLFLSLLLLSCSSFIFSQSPEYHFTWEPGMPIDISFGSGSNSILLQHVPNIQNFKGCSGVPIYFSLRFGDLDKAICSKGEFKKQFPGAEYRIVLETDSEYAFFENGEHNYDNINYGILTFPNPFNRKTKWTFLFLSRFVWTFQKIGQGMI